MLEILGWIIALIGIMIKFIFKLKTDRRSNVIFIAHGLFIMGLALVVITFFIH